MPFSSSICLTNTGTLPLGSNVDIYSDYDSYSDPIQTNVSLSDLTSNCPYILINIPDGTTQIKFQDTVSHCCYNLIIAPNNLCDLFGIQLSGFSSTTISEIVAGPLVSSVGANITDYVIDWYGPDDNTIVAFTSGFGTLFGPYNQTHPFTRLSLSGYYAPMIRQIRINGINYSITGGTGFVQANTNCLENQTVQVYPSNCLGNRQEPISNQPQYNNFYFSDGAAFNLPPETLESDFDLDFDTNYFAWSFRTEQASDTIELSFIGDNYSDPIILEYWTVGDTPTETNFLVQPKNVQTATGRYFKKVTNIYPFLRSQNDKIRIKITPNPTTSRTNWELYFKCLTTFNCESCFESVQTPYKFINTSIRITPLICNEYLFQASHTGCTNYDFYKTDLYNYTMEFNGAYVGPTGPDGNSYANVFGQGVISQIVSTGNTRCVDSYITYAGNSCYFPNGGVTTFQKTNATVGGPGNIYMTFQLLSDLEIYYFSYLNNVVAEGLGTPGDNTNLNYYRYFSLRIPIIPETDLFKPCFGDAPAVETFTIHTSSVVTTGQTGDFFWMNLTMPTVTRNISFNTCELECNGTVDYFVAVINNSSTSSFNQYDFVSQIGAKFQNPVSYYSGIFLNQSGPKTGSKSATFYINSVINNTIPMSGTSLTPIPSLSSSTCNTSVYNSQYYATSLYDYTLYYKKLMSYTINLTPTGHIQMFNSLIASYPGLLIYDYNLSTSAVTYSADSYFIGPSIYLFSDSYLEGESIPNIFKSFYCGEQNFSPWMRWGLNGFNYSNVLNFEILCEDIDAPGSSPNNYFVHWYVTGISSTQMYILQNGNWDSSPSLDTIPTDYMPGPFSDRSNGWNGPCPPSGQTHHYRIQLTAHLIDGGTIKSNYSTFTASTP